MLFNLDFIGVTWSGKHADSSIAEMEEARKWLLSYHRLARIIGVAFCA